MNKILKIVSQALVVSLVLLPVPQVAKAASRSVAVVQVHNGKADTILTAMRDKITVFLQNQPDITVVPAGASKPADPKKRSKYVEGDKEYNHSKNHFLEFQFNKALEAANQSIAMLKVNPGTQGTISKAHILKTGILWELKDNAGALQSIKDATSYNLDQKALDDYYYSTKMINFYHKGHQEFEANNKIIKMTLTLKNSAMTPIFVNGHLRGVGPELTLNVPKDMRQVIQVGNNMYVYTPSNGKNHYVIDITDYQGAPYSSAADNGFPYLVNDAQQIGPAIKADQIAYIKLKSKNDLMLKVVSVKSGYATATKFYHIQNINADGDQVARMASDFITSLSTKNVFNKEFAYSWQLHKLDEPQKVKGDKKKIPTKTIAIAAGVAAVVLGAIVAGVALSGSAGKTSVGDSSGNTTTIFSGPPPK